MKKNFLPSKRKKILDVVSPPKKKRKKTAKSFYRSLAEISIVSFVGVGMCGFVYIMVSSTIYNHAESYYSSASVTAWSVKQMDFKTLCNKMNGKYLPKNDGYLDTCILQNGKVLNVEDFSVSGLSNLSTGLRTIN